ncbi:hypothetical protein IOCL2690_000807100 [Leishmania lindenbergi]|uniref:Uncharacterized protein n=1 Tax=Leishmania lindenbergi TaxID=651832 RepID=A0AAW2ZRY2_9TRYP
MGSQPTERQGGSVQNPSPVRVAHLLLRVLNRWNSTAVAGWSTQESPASTDAERDECHSAREAFQTLSSANSTPVATASGRNSPKRGAAAVSALYRNSHLSLAVLDTSLSSTTRQWEYLWTSTLQKPASTTLDYKSRWNSVLEAHLEGGNVCG